jgi:hypothetical protein
MSAGAATAAPAEPAPPPGRPPRGISACARAGRGCISADALTFRRPAPARRGRRGQRDRVRQWLRHGQGRLRRRRRAARRVPVHRRPAQAPGRDGASRYDLRAPCAPGSAPPDARCLPSAHSPSPPLHRRLAWARRTLTSATRPSPSAAS